MSVNMGVALQPRQDTGVWDGVGVGHWACITHVKCLCASVGESRLEGGCGARGEAWVGIMLCVAGTANGAFAFPYEVFPTFNHNGSGSFIHRIRCEKAPLNISFGLAFWFSRRVAGRQAMWDGTSWLLLGGDHEGTAALDILLQPLYRLSQALHRARQTPIGSLQRITDIASIVAIIPHNCKAVINDDNKVLLKCYAMVTQWTPNGHLSNLTHGGLDCAGLKVDAGIEAGTDMQAGHGYESRVWTWRLAFLLSELGSAAFRACKMLWASKDKNNTLVRLKIAVIAEESFEKK
ncbi:hypothetical protein FIBSPDRAFT_883865 [Athelia psychrophila]|uniref:Uncharacterized protein n=1 Tax=Athelia psychrophila TaxID=1759441 RepID=A0A166TL75_9AGAM|nr:hypothetical protein FIBSPDRAFT_883865 [Fibularhizoctonia sp. CBS 109695]